MEDIEDSEFISNEHDILLSAVSKLDRTQHITEPTRNEPTIGNSEFSLVKRSSKLDIRSVAKLLEETATHLQISRQLKKTFDPSKVLPTPLEKPQAQRIQRAVGYEEAKKKVSRWDPVVARSRTAEYAVFPIKPVETKLQPTNEFLARFELKSELERQLDEIDPAPQIEEEEEEEKIYPMSYEEMLEHSKHLAKIRAQQSYKEAKAKRQSKIKSKKYHRVLKKERLKNQLKEFEELQKTNPEEALKKLEAIEKGRALERHTLRHKNTGKWAKNKLIRAKYDKDVRQQLAEQLAVSRNLTQKTKTVESSDDEADTYEVSNDMTLSQDPMNPWMLKEANKSNVNSEFDFGYKKYLKDKMLIVKDKDDDSESEEDSKKNDGNVLSTDMMILKQSINRIGKSNESEHDDEGNDIEPPPAVKSPEKSKDQNKTPQANKPLDKTDVKTEKLNKQNKKAKSKNEQKPNTKKPVKKLVATSTWVVEDIPTNNNKAKSIDISSAFEELEDNLAGKVERKLTLLRKKIDRLEKTPKKNKEKKSADPAIDDSLEYLKLKNKKKRAIIDEALNETGLNEAYETQSVGITPTQIVSANTSGATTKNENSALTDIDPNRFIQVKPKYLNTALPQGENGTDLLDDDEQVVPKVNIEEVFEEDDVVASFRQEKEDEINKDKPEEINLSLPGWGSWGGKGVKAPKRKRTRIITKEAPKMPRRDDNKGDIIIKEYREPKLLSHKVKDLPFPFESIKDFEASIRAPMGNTFIPEKAHKKLIRPSVITKAGAIIEPMDEDELLLKKNRNFMNEKVLKMLGQK